MEANIAAVFSVGGRTFIGPFLEAELVLPSVIGRMKGLLCNVLSLPPLEDVSFRFDRKVMLAFGLGPAGWFSFSSRLNFGEPLSKVTGELSCDLSSPVSHFEALLELLLGEIPFGKAGKLEE